MDAWLAAIADLPESVFETEPSFGAVYSGPGGRARSSATFEE
jgi:hypothetical protein